MKTRIFSVSFLLVGVLLGDKAQACSIFRVTAQDGTLITARTMEFGHDLQPSIMVIPRGREVVSPAPQNKTGLKWKSAYGYVGINPFGDEDGACEGMNEAGLGFSALWYEKDTRWQEIGPGESDRALGHTLLGTWILGNFSTVEEVKEAIKKVRVFGMDIPQMGGVPPFHFAVYDAGGGAIVIEYDDGVLHVYDNPLGIMTNAPNFPWMMTNLRSYVGMSNEVRPAQDYSGVELLPTGHGNGMLGFPGDLTPPSRFVRMAVTLHFADEQKDAKSALNLAQHVINTLDIVRGMAVDRDGGGQVTASEETHWVTFWDHTNKVFYFRTYENLNLRKIDLKRIDFSRPRTFPMSGQEEIIVDLNE